MVLLTMNGKKEFGDYQTPKLFANKVCELLSKKYAITPQIVIEPTCGIGNFLQETLRFNAKLYYGIEINGEYCSYCREKFADLSNVKILNENIFEFNIQDIVSSTEETLIIGNPPWITNSELSKNNSTNLPQKSNIKSYKGFNAITGESNFDICEYIILSIIEKIKNGNAVVAMLCKSSVARNIFTEINRRNINYASFSLYNFNAKKVFNISASACLLIIDFRNCTAVHSQCIEFDIEAPLKEKRVLIYSNGGMVISNCDDDFWGNCCFEWRQGIKHDCAQIMELAKNEQYYINGCGEIVNVESNYIFPLIKSSMIKKPIINSFEKYVIVTQMRVKENTSKISLIAPKTWEYLLKHRNKFDSRKSSIYKNSPEFSMFGIGDYSFSKYKVAISGFYKVPMFSLLYSTDKPVMCDDTSYFIAFANYNDAYAAMLTLNTKRVRNFLQTVSFQDSKRPFTKKLLNRLSFKLILEVIKFNDLLEVEKDYGLQQYITLEIFNKFKEDVYLLSGF